jgi:hypothetical protein
LPWTIQDTVVRGIAARAPIVSRIACDAPSMVRATGVLEAGGGAAAIRAKAVRARPAIRIVFGLSSPEP